MKKRLMIIISLILLIFLIVGIGLYFYSGGNMSDLSKNELIETIEDNVNARSQITGNKLLVKRCIQQLNRMLADEDADAEFYIEDKIVYFYYVGNKKEITIKEYIQNIKEEKKLDKEIEEIDKELNKYNTNKYLY